MKEIKLNAGYSVIAKEIKTELMGSSKSSIEIKVLKDGNVISCTEMDKDMCGDKTIEENMEYLISAYLDYSVGLTESEQKKVAKAIRPMVAAVSM